MVAARDLQALRDLKRDRFGRHPSQLPGWKPLWKRQREAAAGQVRAMHPNEWSGGRVCGQRMSTVKRGYGGVSRITRL